MFTNGQNTKNDARNLTSIACATLCLMLATGATTRADLLDKVMDRATQARDKAAAAKESAAEIRNRIRDAAKNLAGNVKDAVTEAVQDVSEKISVQMAGKKEFESQHCDEFRWELIATLENLQALDDQIKAMINPCQPAESSGPTPLISLLKQAPCGVLYPLYKVEIDFCPLQQLVATVDAVRVVQDVAGGLNATGELALDFVGTVHDAAQDAQVFAARLNASRIYLENHDALADACTRMRIMSRLLDKLGSRLKAKGEKNKTEASVGIHGYAHVKIASNHKKEMGEDIQSIAKVLAKVADYIEKKMKNAQDLSTENVYLTNQATIIANQEAILAALSE